MISREMLQLLLLRSANVGRVMSNLEVDVLNELGSCLKFLLGSPQFVPGGSQLQMATGVFFRVCRLDSFVERSSKLICFAVNSFVPALTTAAQ